jgi:hypothetical protein
MKKNFVKTKSVSIIIGPGCGKSVIADLIALYETNYILSDKKKKFCHITTRDHLLDQRKIEVRRRMPDELQA